MNSSIENPESPYQLPENLSFASTQPSESIYSSALEDLSNCSNTSLNDSALNSLNASHNKSENSINSNDLNSTLNASVEDKDKNASVEFIQAEVLNSSSKTADKNSSIEFIQTEGYNNSLDEVDPKSNFANKTVFKSDNPNLSIIEISSDNNTSNELENSVVLIEAPDNAAAATNNEQPSAHKINENAITTDTAAEKRRKKTESLLQSKQQKLNIAIAEASALADEKPSTSKNALVSLEDQQQQPETKREIKIYDTLEEFERNLPSTVTMLDTPFGSKVYLVGTAHFSEESQDDVSFVS